MRPSPWRRGRLHGNLSHEDGARVGAFAEAARHRRNGAWRRSPECLAAAPRDGHGLVKVAHAVIEADAQRLDAVGLITDAEVTFATRAGLCAAVMNSDLSVTIDMGSATALASQRKPVVTVGEHTWAATGVAAPNPHAVVFVDDLDDAGSLAQAPVVAPGDAFPDGVNVEFVVRRDAGHVAMRVHERGVGETMSCGTGACAVAWVVQGGASGAPGEVIVDVPGGSLRVRRTDDGRLLLTGPADLVARGTVLLPA